MSPLSRIYNIADLREAARRKLPKGIFEFIDRGTEDETLLRRNRAGFEAIQLRPRMLVDVSKRTSEAHFLGQKHAMPVAIAPTGAAGLVWHEGELAIARAAAEANIPFTLATGSMTSMEKVAEQAGGRLWFQLYMWADRTLSHRQVARARAAGFEGLVVTVDTPVLANREYNPRNGFALPFNPSARALGDMLMHPGWLTRVLFRYLATTGMPTYENFPEEHKRKITRGGTASPLMRSDSLSWPDIQALRDQWPGTFMVKGILRPDDAVRAFKCGADAVILSNHGGRNLDSAVAPIDILPEVRDAVGPRNRLIVDSGVRRGSDVVKALALGAHGVLIGRAPLYGAAVAGTDGVLHAIGLLRRELELTLGMVGCPTLADLDTDLLRMPGVGPSLPAPVLQVAS
ncbi:alpha-hydroxy acid oxidase [Roseixanthobacter liquoris]|uniref:alpha-hydroxy acid oxidase n=1 Tax=Roseixanthobacter liquoris TaxID=3119921 RepID=UPI0037262D82